MAHTQVETRAAFTITEVSVAVAVAGLLACIAVPTLSRARDARAVHAAVREVAEALSLARDEALAQRALTVARIDTVSGTVTVGVHGRIVARFTLGANHGVSLSVTRDSVTFDARGLGYGPANLTLVARRARAADTLVMSRLGRLRY